MSTTKTIGMIFIIAVLLVVILFSSHLLQLHGTEGGNGTGTGSASGGTAMHSHETVEHLLKLIHAQNHTIVKMSSLLEDSHLHPSSERPGPALTDSAFGSSNDSKCKTELQKLQKQQQNHEEEASDAILAVKKENERLKAENARLQATHRTPQILAASVETSAENSRALVIQTPPSSIEASCERRYGLSLITEWKAAAEVWCGSGAASADSLPDDQSKLVCYPYKQEHRKISRSGGPDTICVASNFVIDFAKVSGEISHSKLSNYLSYKGGALQASCKKTAAYAPAKVHKHLQSHLSSFTDGTASASGTSVEETPTYLLTRDEDMENSFHSTADFMNMFVVDNVIGVDPADQQVLLWDKHPDGPYLDLIQKAYAGGKKALRHQSFAGKKIMFRKLIFHMESPAGLIFPKVANPGQLRCKGTGLFKEYAKHILHSFGLWDVSPPEVPHITLLLRHRTERKNVGRILANEAEVTAAIAGTNMVTYKIADTAGMPYAEQLALVRKTNILVGVHGAGLMLILFAANEAVLVEVHPSYRQDRHFRHASRMIGKDYMPVRANERETCQGSSDNVKVPMDEFKKALDGAIRLARGYDNGISECGRLCPPGVLALDMTLNSMYGPSTRATKGQSINTRFPC